MKSITQRLAVLAVVWFVVISTIPGYTDMRVGRDPAGRKLTLKAFTTNLRLMFFAPKTYHINKLGGTNTQCTGLSSAAYPGSGSAQTCAYNDIYQMLAFSGAWASLVGGDTIQYDDLGVTNTYYYGEQNLGVGTDWHAQIGNICPAANTDGTNCALPALPNGTSGNPTQILGANPTACYADETKCTYISGINHIFSMFNTAGTNWTKIAGFDMTQPSQCSIGSTSGFTHTCSIATNNYAKYGIMNAYGTGQGPSNLIIDNMWIHGISSRAIVGSHFGQNAADFVTFSNINFSANGLAGFDTDAESSGGGNADESFPGMTINLTNIHGKWEGCMEVKPLTSGIAGSNGYTDCLAQSTGGYGDCFTFQASPGNWNVTDSSCDYSTQDGWDGLHIGDDPLHLPTILFLRVTAKGNMGQQFKMGGNATSINGQYVGNCFRLKYPFSGNPTGYNTYLSSDYCRAGNNAVTFQMLNGQTTKFYNNTLVSYSKIAYTVVCAFGQTCSTSTILDMQNNITLGYPDADDSNISPTNFYYGTFSDNPNTWIQSDPLANTGSHLKNNLWFGNQAGAAGGNCPASPTYEVAPQCGDPLLVGEGSITSQLDGVNFNITATSPAIAHGVTLAAVPLDFNLISRPNPPAIGSDEYGVLPPTHLQSFGVSKSFGQTFTF